MLAVGEPHYDLTDSENETTTDAGSVRLYRYDPTSKNWTQIGSRINGTDQLGNSGYSVALSNNGSVVAIGLPTDYLRKRYWKPCWPCKGL